MNWIIGLKRAEDSARATGRTASMNTPHRLLVMLTALALGGCGEFAYKTGAGADALAADKQACQQTGGDLQACMHAKGWTIANLSGDDTSAAAETTPATAAPMTPSMPGAPPTAATASAAPAVPPPAPIDPMAPVKMTAWVKFGGGGPQDDIKACVAKLGPASAPDTIHHTATRALLACMKEKGWRGL
jgi:hypothetical protein